MIVEQAGADTADGARLDLIGVSSLAYRNARQAGDNPGGIAKLTFVRNSGVQVEGHFLPVQHAIKIGIGPGQEIVSSQTEGGAVAGHGDIHRFTPKDVIARQARREKVGAAIAIGIRSTDGLGVLRADGESGLGENAAAVAQPRGFVADGAERDIRMDVANHIRHLTGLLEMAAEDLSTVGKAAAALVKPDFGGVA